MKEIKEDVRQKIREIILNMKDEKNIKEYDLLYKTKNNWEEAKKDLRQDLTILLKNLENDDYKDGVKKIDKLIVSLKKWKDKIQKHLK